MSMPIVDAISGSGVPVRGNDIDTDRIVPARFLKCVTFDGLGEHAFADDIAGLAAQGKVHPFVNPLYRNAKILVSNSNFGCGSSREHAPQALMRWGISAIIAESYSEIFFGNCVALGIPCFVVDHATAENILAWIESNPQSILQMSVSTAQLQMGKEKISLQLPEGPRGQFLDGSWNARSQLLANMEMVHKVAFRLPYVSGFAK